MITEELVEDLGCLTKTGTLLYFQTDVFQMYLLFKDVVDKQNMFIEYKDVIIKKPFFEVASRYEKKCLLYNIPLFRLLYIHV